jgi:hypothetical protein
MFYVGAKVKIKPKAWKTFCQWENKDINTPIPTESIVYKINYGVPCTIELAFPCLYLWNEMDLILEPQWEDVGSIEIDGEIYKVGDTKSCNCEYKIIELLPVWHIDTGKHYVDHKNNSWRAEHIVNKNCPIHKRLK